MKLLKWVAAISLIAWAGQYLLAMVMPNLIMEVLYHRAGNEVGYNQLAVPGVPDETSRSVVRPSPDLIYGNCVYNLEDGPVIISAQVPARYWSMQFYQMNTDNFAGITNQRAERHRVGSVVEVTLVGPGEDPKNYPGEVIQSPTDRGIMLLRASAMGDRAEQMRALENSFCDPAPG